LVTFAEIRHAVFAAWCAAIARIIGWIFASTSVRTEGILAVGGNHRNEGLRQSVATLALHPLELEEIGRRLFGIACNAGLS
jgi:hypothetical protein